MSALVSMCVQRIHFTTPSGRSSKRPYKCVRKLIHTPRFCCPCVDVDLPGFVGRNFGESDGGAGAKLSDSVTQRLIALSLVDIRRPIIPPNGEFGQLDAVEEFATHASARALLRRVRVATKRGGV